MSPKQPSKQKRAAMNRQRRAERAARAANARASTSSQQSASGSAAGGRGGLFSRLRGAGTASATRSTTTSGSPRRTLSEARAMQPPGLRAALSGVFAAAAAVGLCALALRYPVDADGDLYTAEKVVVEWVDTADQAAQDQPDLSAEEVAESIDVWNPGRDDATVIKALWPWSIAVVLPLIGAGIALWAVRNRMSSKVVGRAMYATLFGAILTQGLLLLFLPVVLAVGVAMFQVRRSEMAAAQPAGGTAGVIDVDEVEDSVAEDEVAEDEVAEAEVIEAEVIEAEVVDSQTEDRDG